MRQPIAGVCRHNIVQVTDENGNITANIYDALNRLIATTTAPTVDTITTAATTGSTTNGSSTVGVASTAGIVAGMRAIGPCH